MGTAGVAPRECLLQQPIGDAEIDRIRREVPVGARGTAVTQRLHLPNVALRETQLDARAHERVALSGVAGASPASPPPPLDARRADQHTKARRLIELHRI